MYLTENQLLLLRTKLQTDLLYFVRFFFYERNRTKFIVSKHHIEICDNLEKIHSGEIENLIINIPPRYSKTEIASINFPAWAFAINPKCNFLLLSHSDALVNDISAKILGIIQSETYKQLFGDYFKQDRNAKSLWYTRQGGCLHVASIYGQITGFGAGVLGSNEFSGAIILDDLNKIKDVESEVEREKINDTLVNTVISRCNDVKTPIVNIQQRTHLNDVSGFILKGGTSKNFSHLNLPILNEKNEPLWKLKHDNDSILKLQTGEETWHVFETQYMQNPTPKAGYLFPKSELNFMQLVDFPKDNIIGTACAIDTKLKGADNYAAVYALLYNDTFYVFDVVFNQLSYQINEPITHEKINTYNIERVRIESNAAGVIFVENARAACQNATIVGDFSSKNKLARIIFFAERIKKRFVFRSNYEPNSDYDKFIKNLTTFLASENSLNLHDDAPDVCAMLATMLPKI